MRVFVLGTGRCGSTTFANACRHMENFTAKHESPVLTDFPDQHVEVNPRLTWALPSLEERYGETPFYVHLRRPKAEVVASWMRRGPARGAGYFMHLAAAKRTMPFETACGLCYDHMIDAIESFVREKPRVMRMDLATIQRQWPRFWRWIEAEGDYLKSLNEWGRRYNASR